MFRSYGQGPLHRPLNEERSPREDRLNIPTSDDLPAEGSHSQALKMLMKQQTSPPALVRPQNYLK